MELAKRIDLLVRLGQYILQDDPQWQLAKQQAAATNNWFTYEFINHAAESIATRFLQPQVLDDFAARYNIPQEQATTRQVGLVMAGNIPLVGFHDWLCIFLSGHRAMVKTSSKDAVLLPHFVDRLTEWDASIAAQTTFSVLLKGCDAYIATGSNNSSRYFDYYFSKYPHIIRKNRTSVAVLTGDESATDLEQLADDVHLFFGLGCRNVTKLYVPESYDFVPLLKAFRKYAYFADHNKYKNDYDYQLALHLINNIYYMTNDHILLSENKSVFSPISQLNYETYTDADLLRQALEESEDLQCVVGNGFLPFGKAQTPAIDDFADGVDTMRFLLSLS